MARPRKKKTAEHLLIPEDPKTDWQKFLIHVEDNIKLYIAGAVFLVLCAAAGGLIRLNGIVRDREITSAYAAAALTEDPAEQVAKYKALSEKAGKWTPEILYMLGESAVRAEQYDEARQAFNGILSGHPANPYVLQATDALAFLDRKDGNLEAALASLERIVQQWPGEFLARRKYHEMGQIQEELGRIEDAAASYQRQVDTFPDSTVARHAQQALDALKKKHPDKFSKEEEPVAEEALIEVPEVTAEPAADTAEPATDVVTEAPAADATTEVPVPSPEAPAAE